MCSPGFTGKNCSVTVSTINSVLVPVRQEQGWSNSYCMSSIILNHAVMLILQVHLILKPLLVELLGVWS